ncbi:MAG: hypothetical protein ACI4BC_00890, partial [Muribaculaceae bacterium]
RHRSTRTLNPLADSAAAPSKPNFHPQQHTSHESSAAKQPATASGVANYLASCHHQFRAIRLIRVLDCSTQHCLFASGRGAEGAVRNFWGFILNLAVFVLPLFQNCLLWKNI